VVGTASPSMRVGVEMLLSLDCSCSIFNYFGFKQLANVFGFGGARLSNFSQVLFSLC